MKAGSNIKKIIISTWFLAIFPSLMVISILPRIGGKYNLDISTISITPKNQIKYSDLDSDGVSEGIVIGEGGSPLCFVYLKNKDGEIIEQWNIHDSINANISQLFIGNFDHDNYCEVYFFSNSHDSLFLNILKSPEPKTNLERLFITKAATIKGKLLSYLTPFGFYDQNGDKRDEVYFKIVTGYALEPRKIFYYDLINKKLHSSKFTGSIIDRINFKDTDGDQKPEIYGDSYASGNQHKKVPFTDYSAWFMVFNEKLEFEFLPVEFPGFTSKLDVSYYENNDFKGYVLNYHKGRTDKNVMPSKIIIYSPDGKLIREKLYSDFSILGNGNLLIVKHKLKDRIYFLDTRFVELNEKLELIRTLEIPFNSQISNYLTDLDNDGEDELLVYSEIEEKLVIYNAGLEMLIEVPFKTSNLDWTFSPVLLKDGKYKIFLTSGNRGYYLELNKNKYYYFTYFVYAGVYILFFAFIHLILKINTRQVKQKENLKQRLLSLQLKSVKSQLDPHFTFNALNSVASMIYKENRQEAYDYLNKFTYLLRRMLKDAEKVYRSLAEEIEFVKTYLELEKIRFEEKFNFEITTGDSVDLKILVPKMVLQTYAENAVKHGLLPKSTGGILKISIDIVDGYLKLIIEDNGIGRAKAAGNSTSTGIGLMVTEEFYLILNQLSKKQINHQIIDLFDIENKPCGTKIEVLVPIRLD